MRARAGGRVNLLGEHTDYNDGLCLPFAIGPGVTVSAEALDGPRVEVVALGETDAFDLAGFERVSGWRALPRGVVAELGAAGSSLRGTRLVIESDLPMGAGLGSSAALEAALALALLAVAGEPEGDRLALARLCSRAEREWTGADTGLLDQVAVLLARAGHALRVDFRDLSIEAVPLDLRGWRLAVAPSGASHDHAVSGYNERRAECLTACRELGVASLRDAGPDDAARLGVPLAGRVRHVVSENARVDAGVAAIAAGDMEDLGALLDASHASLRDDYEVSVPEVEALVRDLKQAGAAGARIHGGGFGGVVLALFPPDVALPAGVVAVAPGPAASVVQPA